MFGLVSRENKMHTIDDSKKQGINKPPSWVRGHVKEVELRGTRWIIVSGFLIEIKWNVWCIWIILLKMERNTTIELSHNYETSELKPFFHQQWVYITERNERVEIETKKIESP